MTIKSNKSKRGVINWSYESYKQTNGKGKLRKTKE